ncbi:hypothetical protein [Polaromonas sp.]|uniref:hypothetical protein n=1 Tax=Polaromonas sp. TaxID=1869339 RepID=UPI0032643B44
MDDRTNKVVSEVRALLEETYSFTSTAKRAQENINAALDLLDKLYATAPTAPVADTVADKLADQFIRASLGPMRQALSEEESQPFYDLAWEHGASSTNSLAGDELESVIFSTSEFEAFCAALNHTAPAESEHDKAFRDLATSGTAIMVDGKRVDPRDVFEPAPAEAAERRDYIKHYYGPDVSAEAAVAMVGEPMPLRDFVTKISKQDAPKPDYWSSCHQCERNASEAEDLLDANPVASPPAPAPQEPSKAREALRPFANWGRGFGPYGRADCWVIAKSPSGKTLTMGDIRNAVAAYDAANQDAALDSVPPGCTNNTENFPCRHWCGKAQCKPTAAKSGG